MGTLEMVGIKVKTDDEGMATGKGGGENQT